MMYIENCRNCHSEKTPHIKGAWSLLRTAVNMISTFTKQAGNKISYVKKNIINNDACLIKIYKN